MTFLSFMGPSLHFESLDFEIQNFKWSYTPYAKVNSSQQSLKLCSCVYDHLGLKYQFKIGKRYYKKLKLHTRVSNFVQL